MGLPEKVISVGVEDYLEGEKASAIRHEYVDGQVFAMSGSSRRHNLVAGNCYRKFADRLQDGHCGVFINDIKVQVSPTIYYYPDIVVTCDGASQADFITSEPVLIVEVLSPSTEQIDRREKLIAYQRIATLQAYLLASQDQALVEIYRRNADGTWELERLDGNDTLAVPSLGIVISVAEIYSGIQFPTLG